MFGALQGLRKQQKYLWYDGSLTQTEYSWMYLELFGSMCG